MIEDGELRELFKAESEEHLQKIDADLLGLEKEPAGRKLMEELHREAHSLKGAARMLGVRNVEELAHKMESLIAAPLKAGTPFTAALFDALSSAAAALGKLVLEAVTGQRAGVDIPALEQKLEAAQKAAGGPAGGGGGRQGAPPPVAPEGSGERHPAAGGEPEAAHEPEPASSLALNTVRVEAKRLDGLMTHAGELSVLKVRIRR
ncbi:MAG: Hpt domain-containing protein, partial [Nitrospinae bacterium]|nr:Hpt domain-containing protein [Nitrospinota bacterium]